MGWELLAIWLIVIATTVWFVRDERRLRLETLRAQALEYAVAPRYQHEAPPDMATEFASYTPNARASANARQRFIEALQR